MIPSLIAYLLLSKHVYVHDHEDAQSEGAQLGTYTAILDLLSSHTLTISCKRTNYLKQKCDELSWDNAYFTT